MIAQWIAVAVLIFLGFAYLKLEHHGNKIRIAIILIVGAILYFSIIGHFNTQEIDITSLSLSLLRLDRQHRIITMGHRSRHNTYGRQCNKDQRHRRNKKNKISLARGSNPRPPHYQCDALSTELTRHNKIQ